MFRISRPSATLILAAALAGCNSTGTGASDSAYAPPVPRGENGQPMRTVAPMALTAMQENNETFRVETNFREDGPVVLRVEGQSYDLGETDGTSYIFRHVTVPKLGVNNAKLLVGSGELMMPFQITRTITTLDEWRKYAESFDYKRVTKNPDRYAGTFIKGRGNIYQIQEDGESTRGGLNVTPMGYGYWDDNVRFSLPKVTDFVEGDVVSFYGEIEGSYSYESVAGWNITVPMLKLSYLER